MRLPSVPFNLTITLSLLTSLLLTETLQAQQVNTPPPPRPPKRTVQGGLGNTCGSEKPLAALIPSGQVSLSTLSTTPTFWFYIPYPPDRIDSIEFTLNSFDEKTQIYHGSLQATETPGIIGLRLPTSVKLEANQTYYWYLQLNCYQRQGKPISENVDGHISILISTPERLEQLKRAASEIWYDALTIAAERRSRTSTVEGDWQQLLNSIGINELKTEPVLGVFRLPEPR